MASLTGPNSRAAVERLLLWHLWACVPFAIPWMLFPDKFGRPRSSDEVIQMRILLALVGLSLVMRTAIILSRKGGAVWSYVWPIVDVGFITAAARIGYAEPDSWVIAIYMLPVLQAAATLDVRWSVGVAILSAVALGWVDDFGNLKYSYFLFRLALLILVASLVTQLARGLVRARTRLELAQYRSDLAAEMHDGLQQYLGAIAMRMEVADSMAKSSPTEALAAAGSVKEMARQASDELRLMLHRLRSPLLAKGNLEEALRFLANLCEDRTGIAVDVRVEGEPPALSPKEEHALLRIAQEAMTNAAKHAQAKRIEVEFVSQAGGTIVR
ncbi:MAG TPA: histidine kinase, partial [Fimbriimonadaceae bacterium]|nr:histidine kinase [Fimbriimonadaceae bacterium]